jgi:hypothetical protein
LRQVILESVDESHPAGTSPAARSAAGRCSTSGSSPATPWPARGR